MTHHVLYAIVSAYVYNRLQSLPDQHANVTGPVKTGPVT